mgnify:CR=1 FL=1
MKNSKEYYSKDRIKVYHSNVLGRVILTWGGIAFPCMAIFLISIGSYDNEQELHKMITILCGLLLVDAWIFFSIYKTYILLDLRKGKLIVREFPGFSKKEFDIQDIQRIAISDGFRGDKGAFTIDVVGSTYTYQMHSWTLGRAGQTLTETLSMKRQRLEKFAEECNNILNHK